MGDIGLVMSKTSIAVEVEGVRASGSIEIIDNTFDAGDAVLINGVSFEVGSEWQAGADLTESASNLAAAINESQDVSIFKVVEASAGGATVSLTAFYAGADGNDITLAESDGATDNFTLSGSNLSGGTTDQGTYVGETGASKFIEVVEEGLEMNGTKETITRNNLTSTIEPVATRVGSKELGATIPVEFKAGSFEGALSETDPLWRSLFGGRRRLVENVTTAGSHTTSQINLVTADVSKFKKGMIIIVKEPGAFFNTAVKSVNTDSDSITIEPPMPSAPSDNVVLSKTNSYFHDENSLPLSLTRYLSDGSNYIREKGIGTRAASASVENVSTGQVPQISFSLQGIDFDQEVAAKPADPSLDTSLPPIALGACVYVNGNKIENNQFELSIENEVTFINSICAESGKLGSRRTSLTVSGNFPAYKEVDNTTLFDIFKNNDNASIFISLQNPSGVAGEFKNVVGFYLPQVKFTAAPVGEQDGFVTDAVEFSAHRNEGNDTVFMGMI